MSAGPGYNADGSKASDIYTVMSKPGLLLNLF